MKSDQIKVIILKMQYTLKLDESLESAMERAIDVTKYAEMIGGFKVEAPFFGGRIMCNDDLD